MTEALPVPADHRLGLDDEQARPPASPQAGTPDPEDPVSPMELRALHRALEDDDLMAESEVLCDECGAALEQLPEGDSDGSECAHRGSRMRGLPRAYRVAPSGQRSEKLNKGREVPSI
jgi:hypothetical protein